MSKTPKPFQYRDKWRIQVTLKNGQRPFKDFVKHADAVQWAVDQIANANSEHEAQLGGPTQATLAQALMHYAQQYSVHKRGVDSEINRINHYLKGAGLPTLKAFTNEKGGCELRQQAPKAQPKGWKEHVEGCLEARKATYLAMDRLANKRCSAISTANIRALFTQMTTDGLSASTIQKEIALLKAMFNSAAREWAWKGFDNPCTGVKLGKSERRFVYLTQAQQQAIELALAQCDNPYFWHLVIVAKETTMRLDTVMKMSWSLIDLENRIAMLPSKSGQRKYVLPLPVVEVLRIIPRHPSGKVFPMSKNAVKMAWNRVRARAGVSLLQFKDPRHWGATDWVRRGLSAHELKQVLGHSNIQTAQFYVDLVGQDMQVALDRASANGVILQLPPQGHGDGAQQLKMNRQEKVQHALAERLKKLGKVATKDSRKQSPATPESALLAITASQAGALQSEPDDMEKTRVRGRDAVTAPTVPALQTPGGNTFPKNNGHQPNLGASLLPSNMFAFPARKAA
jgi:site-specific recombinase XerD